MSGSRGYLIMALLVALVTTVAWSATRTDPARRNLEVFTEMVYSKAGEPFSPSGVLPGGHTQQPLVEGVVPRGRLPFRYGPGPEEAARAGRELFQPFSPDDRVGGTTALERGRVLYGIACTVCHDTRGDGRGPATLRGVLPPPSLHAARALGLADGELFHILTVGQGNMASYAAQLSPEERWLTILWIRNLQAGN